jgi:hypothetical protein
MSQNPKRPEFSYASGGLEVATWRSDPDPNSDHKQPSYSIRIQRSYFDETKKEWVTTPYLRLHDIPRACVLLIQTYCRIISVKVKGQEVEAESTPPLDSDP